MKQFKNKLNSVLFFLLAIVVFSCYKPNVKERPTGFILNETGGKLKS
jgi:hypothetical protein